jgi:MFS family permease
MTATDGRWHRSMSPRERRTFWACFGGRATDATDVQIDSLLIPVLLSIGLLASNAQAGLIGTVTLLCSAVGGWAAGVLADRYGRALMLLIFRGPMGSGFGGEWAVGAILIGETVRAQYRGRAVGTVQSGWAVGWGVAVGLFVLTQSLFPPETGWRVLFALGVLPALGVFWVRRHVPEPDVFVRHTDRSDGRPSFLGIFRPGLLWTTVVCALLCTGAQGGYYSLTTFLPQFLRSARGPRRPRHRRQAAPGDRRGARRLPLPLRTSAVSARCSPSSTPPSCAAPARATATNFGRGIGAIFPLLVGLLADAISIGVAIAVFAGIAHLVMALCSLLLPETRGAELTGTAP